MKPEPRTLLQEGTMKAKCILAMGLAAAVLLLDTASAQPKVSAANRETVRIMKTIKIPPPYTPAYQPLSEQCYTPPACVSSATPKQQSSPPAASMVSTQTVRRVKGTNAPAIPVVTTKAPDTLILLQ